MKKVRFVLMLLLSVTSLTGATALTAAADDDNKADHYFFWDKNHKWDPGKQR